MRVCTRSLLDKPGEEESAERRSKTEHKKNTKDQSDKKKGKKESDFHLSCIIASFLLSAIASIAVLLSFHFSEKINT